MGYILTPRTDPGPLRGVPIGQPFTQFRAIAQSPLGQAAKPLSIVEASDCDLHPEATERTIPLVPDQRLVARAA
jgi:hypothetical protein